MVTYLYHIIHQSLSSVYPFPGVAALMDLLYINRSSVVRPTLQTLAPTQSSTPVSQYLFGCSVTASDGAEARANAEAARGEGTGKDRLSALRQACGKGSRGTCVVDHNHNTYQHTCTNLDNV